MTWAIAAISVNDQIEKYGAYAGLAAIIGLGVLSLLYFAQAREVKRLREWAGRAPERAAELESRVQAEATRRASGAPLRPQTAAAQAASAAAPAAAVPGAPAAPGATPTPAPAVPAAAEGADKPAPAVPVPGLPVPVPAASGAPAAAAAAGTAVPSAGAPATTAPATASTETPAGKPAEVPSGGNGVAGTPPPVVGPRVPGRPPPTTTRPPVPAVPVPPVATEPPAAARALRGGPPSRTLPPRDTASDGGRGRPSGRVLGVIGGVALVIVAVVVVLLVSTGGDDTPPAPNQVAETTAQTTGSEPARTQSSRQQRVDRADTPVAVLNGTGVNGLARQVADRLQTTGYRADADNTTARPATVVGYKPGAKPAADEIGKLLEVSSAQIQPMPADLAGIAGSHAVVVVLGADKASD